MPEIPETKTAWRYAAWAAALFCVVLACAMGYGHVTTRQQDPLKSPELKALKQQLRESPRDEALKERIRKLDLQLRGTYFHQLARRQTGVWLLIGGATIFLFAYRKTQSSRAQLPDPDQAAGPESPERSKTAARFAVASIASAVAVGFLVIGFPRGTALPGTAGEIDKALGVDQQAAIEPPVTPEEYRKNWPRFLGPDGNGHAALARPPVSWDLPSNKGLAWKVDSPLAGFNSPLIWGERVYFSGGDANKREVICLDLKTGATVWRQAVSAPPSAGAAKEEIPESTGYAPCTMAADGRRVYAIFANGELVAFTLDGKQRWAKNLGPLANAYGHAISLATYKDRLIVQLDQGEAEQGKSKLYAFDGPTGNIVWQKPRQLGASWASPVVYEAAGKSQIATLSLPFAIAYAAEDGSELWRAEVLNGEVTPSPIFAGGLVFVASPSDRLLAIKPDGQGDVAKSHVVWTADEDVPDVTSPASDGQLVFTISTSGLMIAHNAQDGKKQWSHDFEMDFHASPAIARGNLYLFSQKGEAFIVSAGKEYKEVFRATLPDSFHASPAFSGTYLVARGMTNVWCFGPAEEKTAAPNP